MLKKTFSLSMLLIFVASNAILFLGTGIKHDLKFWISYGFVVFSFASLWFFTYWQEDSSMEYLFAITRIRVNILYVLVALAAAIIVNVVEDVPTVVFYGVQLCIAVLFIILMLFLSMIDDRHAEIEVEVIKKKQFAIEAMDRMTAIKLKCRNDSTARKIDQIIDVLFAAQSSNPNNPLDSEMDFMNNAEKLDRGITRLSEEECNKLLDLMIANLKMRNSALSNGTH